MNSDQIEALADRIIALINSQLRSPTRVEIVNTILSVNCDPKLQQPPSDMSGVCTHTQLLDPNVHTLTKGQLPSHGGGYPNPTPTIPADLMTMADVVKIAHDEADHANKLFGYAGLTFTVNYDMMTDNVMVVAECGSSLRPALGFAVTNKAIAAPDAAAIKSAVGCQCFRLGEMMLNAVPERFHS